jgi:aminotransferase
MTQKDEKRGTLLLYQLLAEANEYPDTIFMARGDPDFDTPAHIIEAAREAMLHHANDYTPPEGILPLRQAIAERTNRVNNIELDPETDVVVTNGGQEAVFLMVLSVLAPGDTMLVPEPSYNTYNDALRFAGAEKNSVPTYVKEDFYTDPDRMRQAITNHTRAMLLVSPNNPSASVIPPDDIKQFVQMAREHDLIILSDEIYDRFLYDGHQHLSPASLPGAKERTLTLNASSKTYAMTGWRVGWIAGPADLIAQVRELKAAITGATSIVAQYAALAALTGPQEPVQEMYNAYAHRRRMVMDTLDSLELSYGLPQGGQFLFADISPTGLDSISLARQLLHQEHVLIYPGTGFGPDWQNYMRITFLQPEEKLGAGLERMKVALERILATR